MYILMFFLNFCALLLRIILLRFHYSIKISRHHKTLLAYVCLIGHLTTVSKFRPTSIGLQAAKMSAAYKKPKSVCSIRFITSN